MALAALLMAAEAVSFPLVLPKPAHVEMRVEQTREDSRNGQVNQVKVTSTFDKTIAPTADGYRVTLKPLETKLPDTGSTTEQAKLQAMVESFSKRTYIYAADESLRPTAMEDWPGVVADMGKTLAIMAADQPNAAKALETTVAMFARMSPQQAAGVMLREDGMLTMPINATFEVGKPRVYEDQLPNPLGGPPIKADGAINLESIDQAKGVALVRWTLTLDPKSTSASISQAIKGMLDAQGKSNTPEAAAIIDKIKLERASSCLYEVDLKIGLPVKADCATRIVSSDPTGQTATRNERWVITQTLKN